jgi:8-hydroxy-5-deazaflavin:NADPH oxidoreductase
MSAPLHRRHVVILLAAAAFAAPAAAQEIPARPFIEVPVAHPIPATKQPMKIGVVGAGNIGGTIGELFAKAGHTVVFSDRDEANAKAQAARVPGTRALSGAEAIAASDVIVMGIPFGAWPAVAKQYGAALKGKIVIDPTNPNATRDGELAKTALTKPSTGEMVAEFLPGVRLVRMGIPVAASDAATLAIGVRLVNDIGFEAVPVPGGLHGSAKFELRGPANGLHTAAQLKSIMGL